MPDLAIGPRSCPTASARRSSTTTWSRTWCCATRTRALLAALAKIDANATADHANMLETARRIDAAVGLLGGPLAFVFLVGAAAWSWLRYGKDPVYLDDPSIHMPAPPPDLTAASGAVVWEGRATRRALTTAMLDLASRGELSFREESGLLGIGKKAGIQIELQASRRSQRRAQQAAAAQRRGGLCAWPGCSGIASPSDSYYIEPEDILKFGKYAGKFDKTIEKHVTSKGWFREPPEKATSRWRGPRLADHRFGHRGFHRLQALPSGGLTILGGPSWRPAWRPSSSPASMPARTMAGAMIFAMLAAYRRTLQKTMEQARSMEQVVQEAKLPTGSKRPTRPSSGARPSAYRATSSRSWQRSAEDVQAGVTSYNPWFPIWYGSGTVLGWRQVLRAASRRASSRRRGYPTSAA